MKGKRVVSADWRIPSPVSAAVLSESEWGEVCGSLGGRPEKSIRLRPQLALGVGQSLELPYVSEPVPWYSGGCYLPGVVQPAACLEHAAGLFFVQDAGSMLALRLLNVQPWEQVADICAAPGAKASAILEVVGPGGGFLLANEPIQSRQSVLSLSLARVGFPGYVVTGVDPERLSVGLSGVFDAVLVDAPCSGQSMVARDRQSLAAFSESQVQHSAARQRRILSHAARLVRPGGRLVYSTCTFATAENEGAAAWFLGEHGNWCEEPEPGLECWRSAEFPGGYRVWPHRDRCAGGYAIRLRRTDGGGSGAWERLSCGDFEAASCWDDAGVGRLTGVHLETRGRQRFGWSERACRAVLECAVSGPEVAYQPAKHWLPSHALSLRRDGGWEPASVLELGDAEARKYLEGQALGSCGAGWHVVRWRGNPLGWVHSHPARANNCLPAAARQRLPARPAGGGGK